MHAQGERTCMHKAGRLAVEAGRAADKEESGTDW